MEERHFVKNDQGFVCAHCGQTVEPLGYTSRNHCPHCLYSLHVDIHPGDRQNPLPGPDGTGRSGHLRQKRLCHPLSLHEMRRRRAE